MKRFLCVSLALLLCLSLFSFSAAAEGAGQLQKGEIVYLGSYHDSPIRWKVLDPAADNTGAPGVFLLADYALENQGVIYDNGVARWKGSVAQAWCADFAQTAFSPLERSAVPAVSKDEDPVEAYGLHFGEADLEEEQVFFLSVPEAQEYIGPNDGDAGLSATLADGSAAYWWLRTPHGSHDDYSGLVLEGNEVHDFLVYGSWGVRPACNLSAEAVLCWLPAEGQRQEGDFSLPAGSGEWKPLLLDSSLAAPELQSLRLEGGRIQLEYGAAPAEGCWLSLLIADAGGSVVGCGRICPAQAGGSAALDLSALNLPEGGSLSLFLERESGDDTAASASALCPLCFTLRFDAGEGSGEMETVSLPLGAGLSLPACGFTAPEGMLFDHWEADGALPEEGSPVESDLLLTAVYRQEDAPAQSEAPAAEAASAPAADRPSEKTAMPGDLLIRLGLGAAAVLALLLIPVTLLEKRAERRRDEEE